MRATFRILSGTIRLSSECLPGDHRKSCPRSARREAPQAPEPICYVDSLVIDTRVRPRIQGFIGPIGKFLVGIGVSPAAMTTFGLVVTITGAVVIGLGHLITGSVIALAGSALDGLDGT